MSGILVLDSTPLGLLTKPQASLDVTGITNWLVACIDAGAEIVVPAIIHYETRRELLRARKIAGLARLDDFVNSWPHRYMQLSDGALRHAAELWAQSRQAGRSTSDSKAIDVDVLLAAQAIEINADVVATENVSHLSQFVAARHWKEIPPKMFRF